ncbi:hypothetical protein SBA6_1130030 [Candidatus Sulfopaludibacter sp. SbA6]|nr:hypothetical protein SBA6_1130030 [Candidatus Sulfopaludibacter sp. SbA6]
MALRPIEPLAAQTRAIAAERAGFVFASVDSLIKIFQTFKNP